MITFFLPSPLGGEGSGVRGKSPQKPSPHPNPSPPRGEGLSRFLRVGRARLADGTARVASQSNGTTQYHVVNGHCNCKDFAKASHGFCKHRLSAAIARRAQERVKAKLADMTGHAEAPSQPAPTAPLPEAPVSITLKAMLHGHEVLVTLRGVDFASVKAQVEDASQWLKAQSGQTADETPQCPTHGVPMKLNHGKDGRTWYSHKTVDGWCKGK